MIRIKEDKPAKGGQKKSKAALPKKDRAMEILRDAGLPPRNSDEVRHGRGAARVLPVTELKTHSQIDVALKKGPGRPAGPARVAVLSKLPPELLPRLERTRLKRKLETRNDTIVALLDEGAEK